MHEASITEAMLNMALEHAQGCRITDIYLRAGRMSLVVPESVEFYFEYLSKGTLAEGATLHFETAPLEMTCLDCRRQADLSDWADEQPRAIMVQALAQGCECGSKNLRVTAGTGFNMVSLEVEAASTSEKKRRTRND
ncbi:MAG: hydrogenase maturation nickel metallochaperone HypA [Chloroflexi bacterium]|nr:hydrogenase maturation nickel metallochaperone HypA [Chloroflexota bacterium]